MTIIRFVNSRILGLLLVAEARKYRVPKVCFSSEDPFGRP